MKKPTTSAGVVPVTIVDAAWQEVGSSFDRFRLTTSLAALGTMTDEDVVELCCPR